jgi:hypothetical protein
MAIQAQKRIERKSFACMRGLGGRSAIFQRYIVLLALTCAVHWPITVPAVTNGYITAFLTSECTSVPVPPPPGEIAIGPDYVVMTVADADPHNFPLAQQFVTDAIFESLMPRYCALSKNSGIGCPTNKVQWAIRTFDVHGNTTISGCAASGCQAHYCKPATGYITAVVRGESATLPLPPPVGVTVVGSDCVMATIADGDPENIGTAQQLATNTVFEALMRVYCALPRGVGPGYASGKAQWNVATYDPDGTAKQTACASSGCELHSCVVTKGYITAFLGSECTSLPVPPPPGEISTGPDYVIMTLADADPGDFANAQRIATDAVFESLMPRYCALPPNSEIGCVTNKVQWAIKTFDAGGNPSVSGCAASGCQSHYCGAANGYITAVVRGAAATLPPPSPVGVIAIGDDSVMMTLADGDPSTLTVAQQLATEITFTALMRTYCALPRGNGPGLVSGQVQWEVATFNANGNLQLSACAASNCNPHFCVVSNGYITAVLRGVCTSAPVPPPLGQIGTGPDYVIMTVADSNPRDFVAARQLVTDAIFESLMPLYCALPKNSGDGCVNNKVQWGIVTYDAGGNFTISGCAASGCQDHYCIETNQSSPTLIISGANGDRLTLSWVPRSPGWVLQETLNFPAGPWSNSPTAGANPVTLPGSAKKFYRLSKQ